MKHLDARRRAMLQEMGVKVWWPLSPPASARAAANDAVPAAVAPAIAIKTIAASAISTGSTGQFGSKTQTPPVPPAPQAATIRAPAAAGLWLEAVPRRLYATGDAAADPVPGGWLVVVDTPPDADGTHGAPFEGDAGRLLDNMLRALQLHRGGACAHLLRVHRGAAPAAGAAQPLAEALPTQLAALAPRMVLALGPLAAQQLAGSQAPLGRLRGQLLQVAAAPHVPLVASYAPSYLLRQQADKARAWADLCLAAQAFEDGPTAPARP